jgi:hypothetical protein
MNIFRMRHEEFFPTILFIGFFQKNKASIQQLLVLKMLELLFF